MIDNQDISLDGFYLIEDGKLKKGTVDSSLVEIAFSGTIPSDGSLVINKGSVEAGCMMLDDYKITILNDTIYASGKGTCNGIEVYYDVTSENGKECKDSYSIEKSNTGISSGCMKWYIYDADETTYTMILDHNTSKNNVAWNSNGNNESIPNALLAELELNTNNWDGVENPTNYAAKLDDGQQLYTINYSEWGNKARLISAEEIAKITGADKSSTIGSNGWTLDYNDYFYFGSLSNSSLTDAQKAVQKKYGWLFDRTNSNCESNGCANNALGSTDTHGYWTSSPNVGTTNLVWYVNKVGSLNRSGVSNPVSYGVRPVITVSKSSLIQ